MRQTAIPFRQTSKSCRGFLNSSIDLAAREVNELRTKCLRARNPSLRREYETQWRGARVILAALYALKRDLVHAN